MDINLLLIFLLSHIIFDFIFQYDFILKMRFPKTKSHLVSKQSKNTSFSINKFLYNLTTREISILGNLIHSLTHFIGIYLLTSVISVIDGHAIYIPYSQALQICFFHFLIDELKSLAYLKNSKSIKNIWIFCLDQLLHLIVISLVFSFSYNINIINVIREKLLIYPNGFSLNEKLLIVAINISITTWGIGIFIKILMSHLSSNNNKIVLQKHSWYQNNPVINKENLEEDAGAPNGGFTIGILERIFILISIVINYPMMIGFILTVKSVARFKKLSNDSFAEYFIIGTFLSFIPAILSGIIIRSLF
ncbi:MAG: DUF3307 domain-containing protein [Clostridium sp.]